MLPFNWVVQETPDRRAAKYDRRKVAPVASRGNVLLEILQESLRFFLRSSIAHEGGKLCVAEDTAVFPNTTYGEE